MRPVKQANFKVTAKTALLVRGLSIASLAQDLGYSREAVSAAINRGRNRNVRAAVAAKLGLPHVAN